MSARSLLWLACAALACGCGGPVSSPALSSGGELLAARSQLTADLHKCSDMYGYSPRQASNIAEHALAPHELDWNRCAYNAIRTYEKANPPLAPMYEGLISSYETMTDQLVHGTLTRSQRLSRTQEKLQAIQEAENSQIAQANLQQVQLTQQQQNVIDTARMLGAGFR